VKRLVQVSMCLASAAWASTPLKMADLKALAKDKSHAEILQKAGDVAPSERTPEWKELVAAAATASLKPGRQARPVFGDAVYADSLVDQYAFLDSDSAFDAARDEAVLRGITECMKEDDAHQCWNIEARYEATLTGDVALKAAKAFVKNGSMKYRPMGLFAAAITSKDSQVCKDADLADALAAAFDLPPHYAAAKAAVTVAFNQCWKALSPTLKDFMRGAETFRMQNLCKPMRAKKWLSELQEDLCRDAGQ
jgi:hypothetical protein